MIWVAIVVGLVAIVALAVGALGLFKSEEDTRNGGFIVSGIAFAVAAVLVLISSITVVGAGKIGVQTTFGTVNHTPVPSGLHMVNPFSSVKELSIQTENYWMSHVEHEGEKKGDDSVMVRSSNGLQMPVDVSVPYRLVPESAPWVMENLGPEYANKILRVSLSTASRRAASHFTSEELYSTKRDEFTDRIRTLLEEELKKFLLDNYKNQSPPEQVLVINQVLVGHIGIPDTVKNAIEAKLKADQEQQAMEFTIKREQKEAERKKVEAEGIRQFQEIVTKGIDEKLLRWKAIDATLHLANSPNTKIIIIGGGRDGLPVLLGGDGEPMIQVQPGKK